MAIGNPTSASSFKNLLVWCRRSYECSQTTTYTFADDASFHIPLSYLRAQIDNSLDLGWRPNDLMVVTNFPFTHNGVHGIPHQDIFPGSAYINKWTALRMLWCDGMQEDCWFHDADAFQLIPFEFPQEVRTIGFIHYMKGMQGGSVFFRRSGQCLLDLLIKRCMDRDVWNEEPVFWETMQEPEHRNELTVLNPTYNVGRTRWQRRYDDATKPIRVIHFKPHEKWRYLPTGQSVNSFLCPPRLQNILKNHNIWHPEN